MAQDSLAGGTAIDLCDLGLAQITKTTKDYCIGVMLGRPAYVDDVTPHDGLVVQLWTNWIGSREAPAALDGCEAQNEEPAENQPTESESAEVPVLLGSDGQQVEEEDILEIATTRTLMRRFSRR